MLNISVLYTHGAFQLTFSLIYFTMIQISVVKTVLAEQRKTRIPNKVPFPLNLFDSNENPLCHSETRSDAQTNLTSSNKGNSLYCAKSQEELFRGFMFL